jgi:hypothetical protein
MPIAEHPAAVISIFERGWNEGDFSDLEEWLALAGAHALRHPRLDRGPRSRRRDPRRRGDREATEIGLQNQDDDVVLAPHFGG